MNSLKRLKEKVGLGLELFLEMKRKTSSLDLGRTHHSIYRHFFVISRIVFLVSIDVAVFSEKNKILTGSTVDQYFKKDHERSEERK